MKTVFLGLGSNIENRLLFLIKAIKEIEKHMKVTKVSTVYESKPWGVENQNPFLNCVIEAQTSLNPEELLHLLKQIERNVGRVERFKWGPREIDIDILLYDEIVVDLPYLCIPHPFLLERDFFLYPLLEINKELRYPPNRKRLSEYANITSNTLKPFCCITYRP